MQKISDSDFQDLPELAIRLITKEVLQAPRLIDYWNSRCLHKEVLSYGYTTKTFYCSGDSKHYVFAIREFSLTEVKRVPSISSERQEAEKHELWRQQMGYVTQLELELARECIKTMTLKVDNTQEMARLKAQQSLYGLLWLGYAPLYYNCLRFPTNGKIIEYVSKQHRLQQLKQIRCLIIEEEEYFRLKSNVKQNRSEPARYVKDYLKAERDKKRLGDKNSSLFGKLLSYFKPVNPSKSTEEDEEDQENRTYNHDECENERLFVRKTHSTPTLEQEKKKCD